MLTYKMYVITPSDHMSHDVSYASGPSTSGARRRGRGGKGGGGGESGREEGREGG